MRFLGVLVLPTLLAAMLGGCAGPVAAPAPTREEQPTSAVTEPEATRTSAPPGRGRDLVLTGPPRIPYVVGSVLTFPDGRTLQLPRGWAGPRADRDGRAGLARHPVAEGRLTGFALLAP